MALEEGIDATDSKLDIDLSLLNLNEKRANEVASEGSNEGLPKVFLMSNSESVYPLFKTKSRLGKKAYEAL